jgi:hypothetical protein
VAGERVLVHAEAAYPAEGCTSGGVHVFEKRCDSMPIAMLPLVAMFANPTKLVSSTMAAAPSCSSRRANSSSLTVAASRSWPRPTA